jgi:hypothetical protein
MTMKLNKAMREEICANVLRATTFAADKKALLDELTTLLRSFAVSRVPQEFTEATVGKPAEWFTRRDSIYVTGKINPHHVLSPERRKQTYISGDSFCFEPVLVPYIDKDNFRFTEPEEALVSAIYDRAVALADKREATEGEIRAFLASCSTTEKVIERMPEFEPHVPKAMRPFPIVASTSNLLSHLFASGFDTTLKESAS